MRIRAFVIAGALAVFPTAFPQSAKAAAYEFWFASQAGALAMLCDLYVNGVISEVHVKEASTNLTKPAPDVPRAATLDAIKAAQKEFKECPLPKP